VESRFVFITEKDRSVRLRLTCRLPKSASSRHRVALSMNGILQAELEVGTDWETWEMEIPSAVSTDGANWLSLQWPTPSFPGAMSLDFTSAATDGVEPDLYPVFGEIFAFAAADGEKHSN
jgi:hypothetical protein